MPHPALRTSSRLVLSPRFVRTMASSSGAALRKFEWLCIIPDRPDCLQKRVEVRNNHLENIAGEHEDGIVPFGGAFMSDTWKDGETPPMIGSVMIMVAETKEQVIERIKKDIYTTSGVWDADKMTIHPFRSAIRSGLPK